jgi:GNAT superfamily N-acetyltransferase
MIVIRNYHREADYEQINQFLIEIYRPKKNANWVQPHWEYVHYHPQTDKDALSKIGIFEDEGKIVAVVANAGKLGEAFFLVHPRHLELKAKLIQYAEDNLARTLDSGKHQLTVYIREGERKLEKFVLRKRYKMNETPGYLQAIYSMEEPMARAVLPKGYMLKSLAEENKIHQLTDLLQYGLKEPRDPLTIEGVENSQTAPGFDGSLNLLVVNPIGDYLAFCGFSYEPIHQIAYLQTVITHPKYRRKGFATACILECLNRVKQMGAKEVIVYSDHALFQTLGFVPQFQYNEWSREY